VLNVQPRAPRSDAYIQISGAADLLKELFRHVYDDWMLSVHTNGHNWKSWFIALICGMAAQFGQGATLTLHSGMMPDYLRGRDSRRRFVRLAAVMYERIICVNDEIAASLVSLGIPADQLEIKPAFLPVPPTRVAIPQQLEAWMRSHSQFISVTMSFRPEYGFELLMQAVSVLRQRYPGLGCLVMGGGQDRAEADAFVKRHRLRETVLLAGDLDHELCLALISRSAVFVRPTFRDGDSISVREAMSVGVPVVASRVGARPKGTLLFDVGDVTGLIEQTERSLRGRVEECHA
jgi:glycosyltransferase involved in cell wall biosynthesis